ncbi:hypothetical protein BaRGS_00007143 [Batillaria attramentaria]|uniref:Uncharacterized protein n=1 Tax=Batillaria attramentaria TaxID=370345 RepID=A0ABD0LQT4_9CAEN
MTSGLIAFNLSQSRYGLIEWALHCDRPPNLLQAAAASSSVDAGVYTLVAVTFRSAHYTPRPLVPVVVNLISETISVTFTTHPCVSTGKRLSIQCNMRVKLLAIHEWHKTSLAKNQQTSVF